MPLIIFAIFVIIPVLEIAVFIQAGSIFGIGFTLMGIVLTAIIGAVLVRQQGFAVINEARRQMDRQKLPIKQVMDGAFIVVAGLLLVTPGFLTDSLGFIFLIPPARRIIGGWIINWFRNNAELNVHTRQYHDATFHSTRSPKSGDNTIIDIEAIEIKEDIGPENDNSPWNSDQTKDR